MQSFLEISTCILQNLQTPMAPYQAPSRWSTCRILEFLQQESWVVRGVGNTISLGWSTLALQSPTLIHIISLKSTLNLHNPGTYTWVLWVLHKKHILIYIQDLCVVLPYAPYYILPLLFSAYSKVTLSSLSMAPILEWYMARPVVKDRHHEVHVLRWV